MAGKKKKGKSGKKGKKGAKGAKEPQMTVKEAILAFQITVAEEKLERVLYDVRGWEEKNRRHVDRNDKLKTERELLVQHLLKQSKDVSKLFENEDVSDRNDVIIAMKDLWQWQRERQKEIEGQKSLIAQKEVEIEKMDLEVHWWQSYKEKGHLDHEIQMKLLEQELEDMQNSFDERAAHLQKSLDETLSSVEQYTEETLAKQKDLASEKAIGKLDKHSRQEVLDNDWLRREVMLHNHEMEELTSDVTVLEKANLEIMSQLFECSIDDLKISRNFFLTQFNDNENLDTTGILEMDLAELSIPFEDTDPTAERASPVKAIRPKSAIQKAVEDKVFSLVAPLTKLDSDSEEEGDEDDDAQSTGSEFFESLLYEEEDFSDYLHLGPLELKLLNVTGSQMPIHEPVKRSIEELEAQDCKPDDWPITQPMLKSVVAN